MNKAHSPINWENYPSEKTPINESNLNKMDRTIGVIDDRVIELDNKKASKDDVSTLISNVEYDEQGHALEFTLKNGDVKKISISNVIVDNVLSETSANPVQNKVVTEEIRQLSEEIVNGSVFVDGWNKLATVKYTKGKYINISDGTEVANPLYAYSDYISVEPFKNYEVNGYEKEILLTFFDSDKNFIKGLVDTNGSIELVTPEECSYIVVSNVIEEIGQLFLKCKSLNPTLELALYASLKDSVIFDNIEFISGKYPTWYDGHLTDNEQYCYSDFIVVVPNAILVIDGVSSDVNAVCFYDESKAFISGGYKGLEYNVPSNAKYVRFGIPLVDKTAFIMTLNKEDEEIKQSENVITVGKGSIYDFDTINEALNHAYTIESIDNPITIVINPGVYEEILYIQGIHYVSLIGTNRNDCIIKDGTAMYNNSPLRIAGQCYVANLTFISTAEKYSSSTGTGKEAWKTDVLNGVKNPEWLTTIGSYAVHCDDVTNGETTVARFENCYMYSETFSAFGSGMQLNNTIELVGCALISNIDEDVYNKGLDNMQGALTVHGKFPDEKVDEPNQKLFVRDCYIDGVNSRCVNMYPSNNAPKASIVFINNTFMNNHTSSIDDLVQFTFDTEYIEKCSNGNNIDFFNRTLLKVSE